MSGDLALRAFVQQILNSDSSEDRSSETGALQRFLLAFNRPGVSATGVLNLKYPITSPGLFNVAAYGAVGDGVTDDTAAITAAIAAAGEGVVMFQAGKNYRVTSTLTMLTDDQTWWMYGAEIFVDGAFAGITIGTNTVRVRRGKIYGGIVGTASGAVDWTAGGCGYRLLKANNCVLRDVSVRFLEKGIEITSPAPPNQSETTQNWITPIMLADCALPIRVYANDSGTANENTFFGGEISYGGSTPSATGRYAITIDRHASAFGNVNGIKFFGTYLGDSKSSNHPNAVYLNGVGCAFNACHVEGFPIPMVTPAGDALLGLLPNMFWGGGANFLAPEVDLDSDGVGIAAPFIYSGQDGAGVAGGGQAASAYVWLAKVLGAASKIAYAVKDATDAITFTVRGDGLVTSGKSTVEGGYRLNGPAASNRAVFWQTAGVARWDLRTNNTAEGGANAGSDWSLNAYSDAGSSLNTPITVTRSTGAVTCANSIKSNSATAGIGYATGAGGSVSQGSGSGKATTVVLSTITGLITMDTAALNAGVIVSFTLTNSAIASTDTIVLQHNSGGTVGAYTFSAQPGSGSAVINVRNATAGSLSEAVVIRFTVIKSVSA